MKKFIDYINTYVLVKVASLNNVNVLTRIISGILTSKAIAVFIGAEGLALIGNLRNFFSSTQSFATLGIYNGVVKYVSKFKDDSLQLSKTISTAFYLGYFATCVLAFGLYMNADHVNAFLFSTYNYTYVIKILALALPFYSLNMFCFSILNGFSKYKIMHHYHVLTVNTITLVLHRAIFLYVISVFGPLVLRKQVPCKIQVYNPSIYIHVIN